MAGPISVRLARRLSMLGVALSLGPAATATRAWAEAPKSGRVALTPASLVRAPVDPTRASAEQRPLPPAPAPVPSEPRPAAAAAEAESDGPNAAVQRELDRLADWVKKEKGELSALVVDTGSGRVVASRDPGNSQNPASNAKILTAAAALAKLGPDFRFVSGVYGAIKDGVAARLVLRSNGDPSLTSRDLERMAKALHDTGLRRVSGDVVVDQSRYDDKFVPPAFEQQPNEWAAFRAPVSAVSIDRNAFVIRVAPGPAGERARVTVEPAAGFVEISNAIDTSEAGKDRRVELEMQPMTSRLRVRVTGKIGARAGAVSFQRRLDDPRLYAGFVLKHALGKAGVSVDGGVSEGGKDETRVLVSQSSEPLSSVVFELGKHSDNFTAEMLFKALGAAHSGRAGSAGDGATAVTEWLRSAGALEPGTKISNGSGLFDANRVSATALCKALTTARRDSNVATAFLDQLAQAGVDGTLRNRFTTHRQRRSIRGKTGTLARTHSLAGYVLGPTGKSPLAFALLVNGIAGKVDEQRRRIDRVVERAATEHWR